VSAAINYLTVALDCRVGYRLLAMTSPPSLRAAAKQSSSVGRERSDQLFDGSRWIAASAGASSQ